MRQFPNGNGGLFRSSIYHEIEFFRIADFRSAAGWLPIGRFRVPSEDGAFLAKERITARKHVRFIFRSALRANPAQASWQSLRSRVG